MFLNPAAGRGRARRRLPRIEAFLRESGVKVDVHVSRGRGDLELQVLEAIGNGATEVIVVGGDGSIHEAVNGIMNAQGRANLGVVPAGTGNDFAKASGIPLNWKRAVVDLNERIRSGKRLRRVDLGLMNQRYFANGAGLGFDARVTETARSIRWPLGGLVYLLAILRCLHEGVATPFMSISGDCRWQGPLTLANISNGAWIGGMFHIAPMADNSDGLFETLIAAPVTRRRILALLPLLIVGRHIGQPEIYHGQARRLRIEATMPVPSQLDGEVQPLASSFEIELLPGALELL